ncbi:piggyBac transposable element-derived protein 4-like, partial [Melanaphis sacchari]|uniref:piggyBac transposable element-derived protein 4-like n=1 Tax=Melanaphis sacchari TaxID=742174 RepID=UPI000DC13EEE
MDSSDNADDLGGKDHAENVVLHLMSEKLNNGHSIYMDNFYNSIDLAEQLLQKKIYCTGTLRSNRKHIPEAVVKSKLKPGETKAMYSNGVLGQEKLKPEPIANYNKFMSGIDRQDQMNSYYPFLRKTIRWYKNIGIHVIQMLLLNSYNLYNQSQVGSKMTLYDFRLSILSELLSAFSKPRLDAKRKHIPKTHEIGKNGRALRKRCCVCAEEKIQKDTSYFCPTCPNQP